MLSTRKEFYLLGLVTTACIAELLVINLYTHVSNSEILPSSMPLLLRGDCTIHCSIMSYYQTMANQLIILQAVATVSLGI